MKQLPRSSTVILDRYTSHPSPSAATVAVYGPDGTVLLASGAATADTATEAIVTGLAGSDTITVASSSGFVVGQRYTVSGPDGRWLSLKLAAMTATTMTFAGEIPWTTTSGLVSAHRLYRSFPTPAATYRTCRAVWTYTSGGVTYTEHDTLDIVRVPFALDISVARVVSAEQLFTDSPPRSPAMLIEQAIDDVQRMLLGARIRPDLVTDRTLLEQCAVWRTLQLRHWRSTELRDVFAKELDAEWVRFTASSSWIDLDDDQILDETSESMIEPNYMRIG
jgi:hypothetical protein